MEPIELAYRLSVALAVGLLIGIERGWTMRGEGEGERTAGVRTLALTGLLGGIAGAIGRHVEAGGVMIGLVFAAYAVVLGFLRAREMASDKTFGATTVVASYVAFGLGVLAVVAEPGVAAAGAVATATLLALKAILHSWVKRLTWEELRAALVLLAMTLILLPLLPDRGLGPFGAINPYALWLMTILIAVVSSAGYIAAAVNTAAKAVIAWVAGGRDVGLSVASGAVAATLAGGLGMLAGALSGASGVLG